MNTYISEGCGTVPLYPEAQMFMGSGHFAPLAPE
jgi:hypothetical protein